MKEGTKNKILVVIVGFSILIIAASILSMPKPKAWVTIFVEHIDEYQDYYTIQGTVRNTGQGTAYNVVVVVEFRAGPGGPVASATVSNVGNLAPGEVRSFSGQYHEPSSVIYTHQEFSVADIKVTWRD